MASVHSFASDDPSDKLANCAQTDKREETVILNATGQSVELSQKEFLEEADFNISNPLPDIGEKVVVSINPILEVKSWDFGEANCEGIDPLASCILAPTGLCDRMTWTYATSGEKSVTMVLDDDRTQTKTLTVGVDGECCAKDGRPNTSFKKSADVAYTGETITFTDTSAKAESLKTEAVDFDWTPSAVGIGENIAFTLSGVSGPVEATWDFGGSGCGNFSEIFECSPFYTDCHEVSYQYSSAGNKTVSVTVTSGDTVLGTATHAITILSSGTCGGSGCNYSLSPNVLHFSANSGSGTLNVNTAAECAWKATTSNSWLNITSGTGTNTGPGSVSYNVAENVWNPRTGKILVEGKSHTVRQDGSSGDTAPTAWQWTISLDGQVVRTSTEQNLSHVFENPGIYLVELVAANCFGSAVSSGYVEILEGMIEGFVIPSAVVNEGALNTTWRSDFRFFNPCKESLELKVEFEPEGTNNAESVLQSSSFVLAPNETRVFAGLREAIPTLAEGELTGSVRIENTGENECQVLSVSRTFNLTPDGTLGQYVPAIPIRTPECDVLYLTGLSHDDSYRTNLRLVNFGDDSQRVKLTVINRDYTVITEGRNVLVHARSTKQVNNVARWAGVEGALPLFSVRAETFGADVQVTGAVVDNISGDSVLQLSSFLDENTIWVVGAAHNFGVNDSNWQTDISIFNPTPEFIPGSMIYRVGNSPSSQYGFNWTSLKPGRSRQYLDIVGNLLGGEESSGYIILTGDDGGPAPQISARTFNLDEFGGTFGLNLQAFGNDDLLQSGDTGYVVGISNSESKEEGYRTNLGLLNTDTISWTTVAITLLRLDGSELATRNVSIAPGILRQFDVFRFLGVDGETTKASIQVEVISGGGVAAYAAETDNRTQDSIFIPAQKVIISGGR